MPRSSEAGEISWKQKDQSPGFVASNTGFEKRLSTESISISVLCLVIV